MNYKPTEKALWMQTIIYIVNVHMVSAKTTRFPLDVIIDQFTADERVNIKNGIGAAVEIGLFAMNGSDICATKKGEYFTAFNLLVSESADTVDHYAKHNLDIVSILTAIESDARLIPPTVKR